MKIHSTVVVKRALAPTWAFVSDPRTAPTWDRSIASVELITPEPVGVGSIITTTAPSGMRQSFQITEFTPNTAFTFKLLESNMFRTASLSFQLHPIAEGTRITHKIDFKLYGTGTTVISDHVVDLQKGFSY
jgi:hypothetical protein